MAAPPNESTSSAGEQIGKQMRAILENAVQNPARAAQELNYPSGYEVGLRHPNTGGFLLARDDGAVEMSAGPTTRVLVDGPGGQVTVSAPSTVLAGGDLHLHAAPGRLWFGFQRFNPWYQSLPQDPLWKWRAPVVQRYPESLVSGNANVILAGVPKEGQYHVPLSSLFMAMPLFGPNEQTLLMAKRLAQIMQGVVRA